MSSTLCQDVAVEASSESARASDSRALEGIFAPRSIAVVGATATSGTVPFDIFHNILSSGFTGTLYPVAPGKANICAVRAYRYLLDIPDPVDLAVIVFPAEVVDRAIDQCVHKGIKSVVVISAGFRETGEPGAARERRLAEVCRENGIHLIGPNCLGVINTDPRVKLNASFARRMPHAGRIGFVSQSGALCTAVLDYARDKQIGFSKFVSIGNRAGVSEIELLNYLARDGQTDVILMYLEEVREGRALVEAARRITRGPSAKPIFAIKAGRTQEGANAAASHTGSLAGEDAICDAAFSDAGIVRCGTVEEMFNSAILYAYQPMPRGDRIAIVTNAGGPGVMATDAAVRNGLQIARFVPQTTALLRGALPPAANVKNPVDVIGDARADRYAAAIDAVSRDPGVHQLLVILTPQSMTDIDAIARTVVEKARDHANVPIACSFMGAADVASGIHILQESRVPHYTLPELACRALADVARIREWRAFELAESQGMPDVARSDAARVIDPAPDGYLREDQALEVLEAYGLPVPPHRLCTTAGQAVEFAESTGYPVVLRAVARELIHKSEVRGVALDLNDAGAVMRAWDRMHRNIAGAAPQLKFDGVLVRPMIPAGREVIIGAKHDPSFGPVVMFGMGGIHVELFKDVAFALAPLASHGDALCLIRRTRARRLLEGLRGQAPADIDAIALCLLRASQLVADFPRIVELDINPLIAAERSDPVPLAVADVRIRIH